jgi:pimeloyl-ACP methyl ester carboxylesterase
MTRTNLIELDGMDTVVEVVIEGDSPQVVLIPSSQRGAGDFERLAADLATAGYGSVALNPPGVGRSTSPRPGMALPDVADMVAGVIAATVPGPADLVGHAMGNVFARATAAYRPEAVRTVALLACGGHEAVHVAPDLEVLEHFERCTRGDAPNEQRIRSLEVVFFAPGNDASVWLDGWWNTGDMRTVFDTSVPAEWATAGEADVLIVQPLQDRLCPVEIGRDLTLRLGARGRYVEVPRCGHAMLPEQPEEIARAVIAFLDDHAAPTGGRK